MDVRSVISLALDGLDEGYRVIAFDINEVLALRVPFVQIHCEAKREEDSITSAREKLLRALPKIQSLDIPSDLRNVNPWRIGLHWSHPEQWLVSLICDNEDLDFPFRIKMLQLQDRWDTGDWLKWVVEPVEQHRKQWIDWLATFTPKVIQYSAGEDGFRRDAKIAELANLGWTNEAIVAELERQSPREQWSPIAASNVKRRLTEYYAFISEPKPKRSSGRPKK